MIHILVVDDDKTLTHIICSYLNNYGYEAKGVLSVANAYDEMYSNLYDLISSDIMMPDTDGFTFAEAVRRLNKQIPILFVSARDGLQAKQKGFDLGIDDYMVKPLDLSELLMRVRALLRRANIEASRKLQIGQPAAGCRGYDDFSGWHRYSSHDTGIQHSVQTALLPQSHLFPFSINGRVLGTEERYQVAG